MFFKPRGLRQSGTCYENDCQTPQLNHILTNKLLQRGGLQATIVLSERLSKNDGSSVHSGGSSALFEGVYENDTACPSQRDVHFIAMLELLRSKRSRVEPILEQDPVTPGTLASWKRRNRSARSGSQHSGMLRKVAFSSHRQLLAVPSSSGISAGTRRIQLELAQHYVLPRTMSMRHLHRTEADR